MEVKFARANYLVTKTHSGAGLFCLFVFAGIEVDASVISHQRPRNFQKS